MKPAESIALMAPTIALPAMNARRRRTFSKLLPVWLGLPVIAWQLVFFAAPMLFLVVVTFWRVRSFRLEPALSLDEVAVRRVEVPISDARHPVLYDVLLGTTRPLEESAD